MIDYSNLRKSLSLLQSQFHNYQSLDPSLEDWMQEAVQESVIQRFETCYDCLWKLLKRHLTDEVGLAEVPSGPKPLTRLAAENKLLSNTVEQWMTYIQARIDTTHDYSGEKAQAALELMANFIGDAIDLYQTMSGTTWEE